MSATVDKLVFEYAKLKDLLEKIIENLRKDSSRRSFDAKTRADIEKSFSFLYCNLDQTDKLFQLARDVDEISVMTKTIEYNFRIERRIIQNIARIVYNVDQAQALKISYEISRSHIEEQLQALHNSFEDLVRSSGEALQDHVDYTQMYLGFDTHQRAKESHDAYFEQAFKSEDIRDMARSVAIDIPKELRIINSIERKLNRLYSYLN